MKQFIKILMLVLVSLNSCTSINKAIDEHRKKKATEYFTLHIGTAGTFCSEHFPCSDSTIKTETVVVTKNANYSKIIDSINRVVDSLNQSWTNGLDSSTTMVADILQKKVSDSKKEIVGLKEIIAKLKNEYHPCDSVRLITTTVRVKDSAANVANADLKAQNNLLNHDLMAAKGTASTRLWMFIAACVLIALLLFYIIRKK